MTASPPLAITLHLDAESLPSYCKIVACVPSEPNPRALDSLIARRCSLEGEYGRDI